MNVTEYDIENDKSKKGEMKAKSGGSGIPFIDIEGIYITGANLQRIKQAVEKRRMQSQ